MLITVNGKAYRLWFKHSHCPCGCRKPRTTECFIAKKGAQFYDDIVCNGVASCSVRDNFCRQTGRKVALAKALTAGNFDKVDRAIIWQEYLKV